MTPGSNSPLHGAGLNEAISIFGSKRILESLLFQNMKSNQLLAIMALNLLHSYKMNTTKSSFRSTWAKWLGIAAKKTRRLKPQLKQNNFSYIISIWNLRPFSLQKNNLGKSSVDVFPHLITLSVFHFSIAAVRDSDIKVCVFLWLQLGTTKKTYILLSESRTKCINN